MRQNDSSSQEFYSRTVTALDRKDTSDKEVSQKLQAVKDAAKVQGPVGVPQPQKPMVGDAQPARTGSSTPMDSKVSADTEVDREKSVAGRKTMKGGETKDVHSGKESPKELPKAADKQKTEAVDTVESEEDHEIETELNSILKKGPSKSSRRESS